MRIDELANEEFDKYASAMEKMIEEDIAPLLDFGTPEQYIGKKMPQWTPQEWELARFVFGDEVLHKAKVKRYYKEVKKLESAVTEMEGI